ncbi:MAG: fumarylacetoacetate hydrolase family protein [Micromonosporaceae bacterium]|jgi:2-dehydro-3-deoxy-D-arabinonate dehydratase|nr:fumarylacetoacetate hydrolase family protein [Micromonosporaceae bacterium]
MHLVRFRAGGRVGVGVRRGHAVTVLDGVSSVAEALRLPVAELRARCDQSATPVDDPTLLPPVDGRMEVWAAGVTYTISRDERMAESERAPDIYRLVYDAPRPELFFKAAAWRVVGDGEPIAIREDSEIDVPEPELAVVVNAAGEIVGYLVCNDVSSRSIEGDNPLYLPQAKIYLGSCAVSSGIRPAWEVPDPYALRISLEIERDGERVWHGTASTGQLHRRLDELVGYLCRGQVFPDGVVLSTGTSLVPPLPFTLRPGDVVDIDISEVGRLRTPVVEGVAAMRWLVDR